MFGKTGIIGASFGFNVPIYSHFFYVFTKVRNGVSHTLIHCDRVSGSQFVNDNDRVFWKILAVHLTTRTTYHYESYRRCRQSVIMGQKVFPFFRRFIPSDRPQRNCLPRVNSVPTFLNNKSRHGTKPAEFHALTFWTSPEKKLQVASICNLNH